MSKISLTPNASGTANFTIASPATNTDRTLTLPDSTGTVVVTSGAQTIEFADGSASAPSITNSGDTNTGMFFPAADTIAFAEGGTEAMRLDASGNVGIGTMSPVGSMQLLRSSDPQFIITDDFSSSFSFGTTTGYSTIGTDAAAITFKTGVSTGSVFSTGTERMRINSSGKLVMASTTDGLIGSIQAGITANTASTNAIIISAATANGPYPIGARGESTNQGLVGFFNSSNDVIGSITKSSNNVAYNTSSDYRLKENITPMTGALDKIAQLNPVTYTWKSDGLAGQGFIAHELQEVVPECVNGQKDAVNEDGSIKPQGIDTSYLVATLTAAIKEQQTIIETLKADIAELKAKVNV